MRKKRNNSSRIRTYELLLKQSEVDRKITRLAGQITNLPKGNIEQAVLISGQDLLPLVNSVELELIRRARDELKELNGLISQAIEEIQNEISGSRPTLSQTMGDEPVENFENPILEVEYSQSSKQYKKAEYILTEEQKQLLNR